LVHTGSIGFDEFVVEPKEGVDTGVHVADIGRGVVRIQQEHGTHFDFVGVSRAGSMGTSSEHGGGSVVTLSANHVGMSVSTDDSASKAAVRKDLREGAIDVVTQEDNAVVVKRSGVSRIPRKDCRGMADVDVVRVPLDGEAHGHWRAVREIRKVGANLVRILSRPGSEGVLEGSPVGSVLDPVPGLGEEVGDQRRGCGGGHGRKLTREQEMPVQLFTQLAN
jgi:hypothetical protein